MPGVAARRGAPRRADFISIASKNRKARSAAKNKPMRGGSESPADGSFPVRPTPIHLNELAQSMLDRQTPIRLTDEQLDAVMAAARPIVHRVCATVQRQYFDAPLEVADRRGRWAKYRG